GSPRPPVPAVTRPGNPSSVRPLIQCPASRLPILIGHGVHHTLHIVTLRRVIHPPATGGTIKNTHTVLWHLVPNPLLIVTVTKTSQIQVLRPLPQNRFRHQKRRADRVSNTQQRPQEMLIRLPHITLILGRQPHL